MQSSIIMNKWAKNIQHGSEYTITTIDSCFHSEERNTGKNPTTFSSKNIFTFIHFSKKIHTCDCTKCKTKRINQWPYKLSLSANILWLLGMDFYSINRQQARKLEQVLILEFHENIPSFWKYLTKTCVKAGQKGIRIFEEFKNRHFDKTYVNDPITNLPQHFVPRSDRTRKLEKYYNKRTKTLNRIYLK